jgi:DNA-binding NarL/FixJ family response regulator
MDAGPLCCFVCGCRLDPQQGVALSGRAPGPAVTIRLHRDCTTRLAAATLAELHRLTGRAEEPVRYPLRATAPERLGLTPTELRVLRGIASGKTNLQIAHDTGLTPKSVKNRVSVILSKLAVTSRTEAAALAVRAGLVPEDAPL